MGQIPCAVGLQRRGQAGQGPWAACSSGAQPGELTRWIACSLGTAGKHLGTACRQPQDLSGLQSKVKDWCFLGELIGGGLGHAGPNQRIQDLRTGRVRSGERVCVCIVPEAEVM